MSSRIKFTPCPPSRIKVHLAHVLLGTIRMGKTVCFDPYDWDVLIYESELREIVDKMAELGKEHRP